MKINIRHLLMAGGVMLLMASCSENSWNNHYLDGFEEGHTATDVQTLSYTLTDADYEYLAVNSANKALAEEAGVSNELAAIKSQHYFNASATAEVYMPNYLKDANFCYFSLSDGSALNLTYREVGELPEEMKGLNGAKEYVVSEADYQIVYGSSTDYTAAFSPSYSASANIPKILADNLVAEAGEYVVVNYNRSEVDPNFGGTEDPETPGFELSSVLTSGLSVGDEVTVNGVVTGICTRGIILTDKAGSILVYGSGFPYQEYSIGDQVIATGAITSYKNCMQIAYAENLKKVGSQSYTYPAPVNLTADYLVSAHANSDPALAVYGTITGTVVVDGNYYNIVFDDSEAARGSIYYASDETKALLQNGMKATVSGYFTQTSQSGDMVNANIVVTKVSAATSSPRRKATRSVVVPSVSENAVYVFDGSKWSAAGSNITVIQPADYEAMGLSYGNFSGTQADELLPIFMKNKYPYASADAVKYVAYKYFSNKVTSYACAEYTFDGSKWYDSIATNGVREVTNQFVRRDGKWQLDPSVELTLPAGKNQPLSTWFYQACVDWTRDNVPDGEAYITSYGNNDYYTGVSAYQGNIDLRASSARAQNPTAYEGMTDEQIVALMKKRFEEEVGPGTLSVLYPNMQPVGDFHPTVTIHFYIYDGNSTKPAKIIFETVEKGKFVKQYVNWKADE